MFSIGEIIGLCLMALALAGGAVGTYNTIKNARGPRERAFTIRMFIACWILVACLLLALYVTQGRIRIGILIIFFILCPVLLYKWSTMQQLIHKLDQRENESPEDDDKPQPGA